MHSRTSLHQFVASHGQALVKLLPRERQALQGAGRDEFRFHGQRLEKSQKDSKGLNEICCVYTANLVLHCILMHVSRVFRIVLVFMVELYIVSVVFVSSSAEGF